MRSDYECLFIGRMWHPINKKLGAFAPIGSKWPRAAIYHMAFWLTARAEMGQHEQAIAQYD